MFFFSPTVQPISVPLASRQRPDSGSEPQFALAWDAMRGQEDGSAINPNPYIIGLCFKKNFLISLFYYIIKLVKFQIIDF